MSILKIITYKKKTSVSLISFHYIDSLVPSLLVRRAQVRFVIEYFLQKFISSWASYMHAFVDHTQRPVYIKYVETYYNRVSILHSFVFSLI